MRRKPILDAWVLLVLAVVAFAATPALAASGTQTAHDLYGYPYPNAPDCSEAPNDNSGCVPDAWNFFQGQCTSWTAYRLNQLNGVPFNNSYGGIHWGNASNWGAAARSIGILVDENPAVGAVIWYASPGHVGYAEQINPDGSVVMSEMNVDLHNGFRFTTISRSSRWPSGFIHIADRGDSSPRGAFDAADSPAPGRLHVAGWAFDPDAPASPVAIHAYVGGPAGSGAPGYALGQTSVARPDVVGVYPSAGPNTGFDFTFDAPSGSNEVYLYAINIGPGENVPIGTKHVVISDPNPIDAFDSARDFCRHVDSAPTGTNGDELHCLAASSNYQNANLAVGLPGGFSSRARMQSFMADVDGDGRADFCRHVDSAPTGTNGDELHCLAASSNYQNANLAVGLPGGFSSRARMQSAVGSNAFTALDTIPPVVVPLADRAPNTHGWYNADVTIHWQVTDPAPSSGTPTTPPDTLASIEGIGVVYTSEPSCDPVSNCATGSAALSIDKTAPTITGQITSEPNEHGWYAGPVTIRWTCDDALSGVAACPTDSTLSTSGAEQSVSASVSDVAGNVTTSVVEGINIDTAPPSVEITTADGATLVGNPVLRISDLEGTAVDDLSGVVRVAVTYTPATGLPATEVDADLTCDSTGSCTWKAPPPLVPGPYRAEVAAFDEAGNESTPAGKGVVVLA